MLRLLSENPENGALNLTDEGKQQVNIIHPEAIPNPHATFEWSNKWNTWGSIWWNHRKFVSENNHKNKIAAGPSKLDVDDWLRILGLNVFGNHSLELRRSLAKMTKKLCS